MIKTYKDIKIEALNQSMNASQAMKMACDVTQKRLIDDSKLLPKKLAKFLIDAKHTSVFEHGSMTILASGISRSLLAQVTRQRHFSFTSASQHYQDYRDYPMSLRPGWDINKDIRCIYASALNSSLEKYTELIALGEKPEEARQVLPNACTVNLVITANPRALFEFLVIRLCKRNTEEMQIFACELKNICVDWLPEIFEYANPACITGQCDQGEMACKKS